VTSDLPSQLQSRPHLNFAACRFSIRIITDESDDLLQLAIDVTAADPTPPSASNDSAG